jgi:hypothetical protein
MRTPLRLRLQVPQALERPTITILAFCHQRIELHGKNIQC